MQAVAEGDLIVPLINNIKSKGDWDLIVESQDWHPKGHGSFSSSYPLLGGVVSSNSIP